MWPDNWRAVEVFCAAGTQWRISHAGVSGLDYTALPVVFDLLGVPAEERRETFEGVQVMEREVLRMQSEERK